MKGAGQSGLAACTPLGMMDISPGISQEDFVGIGEEAAESEGVDALCTAAANTATASITTDADKAATMGMAACASGYSTACTPLLDAPRRPRDSGAENDKRRSDTSGLQQHPLARSLSIDPFTMLPDVPGSMDLARRSVSIATRFEDINEDFIGIIEHSLRTTEVWTKQRGKKIFFLEGRRSLQEVLAEQRRVMEQYGVTSDALLAAVENAHRQPDKYGYEVDTFLGSIRCSHPGCDARDSAWRKYTTTGDHFYWYPLYEHLAREHGYFVPDVREMIHFFDLAKLTVWDRAAVMWRQLWDEETWYEALKLYFDVE